MTTTTTSRRAVLAGATALATGAAVNAAAIVATRAGETASIEAVSAPSIDTAPCPLVAEYERALLAYAETFVEWSRLYMAAERKIDLRYGPREQPDLDASGFSEVWYRNSKTRCRRANRERRRIGFRPVARALDKLHCEIDALDERLDAGELDDADPMTLLRARVLSATFEGMPLTASYQDAWRFAGRGFELWDAAVDATGLAALVDKIDDMLRAGAPTKSDGGVEAVTS